MRKPLRILERLHPTRTVVNLSGCYGYEPLEVTEENVREIAIWKWDRAHVVLRMDPRDKRGVVSEDEMAQMRGALFSAIGLLNSIDGADYRVTNANGEPIERLFSPATTKEQT